MESTGVWKILLHYFLLICFIIASNMTNDELYIKATIFLGCFHLLFEVRQFVWNPLRWLLNFWNWFGMYYFF